MIRTDKISTQAIIKTLAAAGKDQEYFSDLSAAYLHLASTTNDPELLLASLEASSKALELRPDDVPALFNRALALSRLNLATTAHRAWEAYLAAAPTDDWAAEAQSFLARSSSISYQQKWSTEVKALRKATFRGDFQEVQTLVKHHRQRSREWAEVELLTKWASASGEESRNALTAAGLVGKVLLGITGDRMLVEGVAAIDAADSAKRGAARLRTGHQELAAGLNELYDKWRLEPARHHFERAHHALSESPFALWADLYISLITYYKGDYAQAAVLLEALDNRVDRKRYPALAGRVLWIQGLTAASTYQLADSVAHYQQALQIFCTTNEEENLAAVHALLGEALSKLGRFEDSWPHIYNALTKVDRIFDPIRHHAVLEVAILNARRQGFHHAGLAFADEHLVVASSTHSTQILHYAWMHRGSLRYALGDLQGAKADLAEASRVAVEDPSLRQRSIADLELVSAEIQIETDPRHAVNLLSRTIGQYERKGYIYLLPQAYGTRAQAFLHLGDLASAEQDLAHQIRIYEESAGQIQQDVFRLSLLGQAAPSFEKMIELQTTKLGRPALGLEYSERGRRHAFLDAWTRASLAQASRMKPPAWTSFDTVRLRTGLPQDVAILEYSLLDSHLLSWVVTRSGVKMFRLNVKRQDIVRRIHDLERGLARDSAPHASHELYDLLVRPAAPLLGRVSRLIIVPDKEIFLVPFEALVDRRTGRFLVESKVISYSPSASLYVNLKERSARTRKGVPGHAVAATGAQNGGFKYERLSQAPLEARSIFALYHRGSLLINPSKEQLLNALNQSQILHFSGHAMPNAEQPFASKLVLADTPTEHVELYAWELYDRTFPQLELVVLSACGTVEVAHPDLGIAATLAGPFLAAGVPRVIGSQWRVKDDSTRLFFTSFHRRVAAGIDATVALRDTKLEFLHSSNAELTSPRVWGAFVLVGS
ncbi:MAG TPA: CHAT domain-containing protein [Thermoanaerobaculia bacterium]|nr:CHAT domain-containing protein [Thermoanaerobaculia bacterium]